MDESISLPSDAIGGDPQGPSLYERSVADTQQHDAEWLAKAALVGLGIHGLGKAFGKNLFAEAANDYGRLSRYVASFGKEAPGFRLELVDSLSKILGANEKHLGASLNNGTKLQNLSMVQDIVEGLGLIDNPNTRKYSSEYTSKLKEAFANAQQRPRSFLTTELEPLRIADILAEDSKYIQDTAKGVKAQDSFEIKSIKRAVKKGIIDPQYILDPGILKDSSGKLLDTRVLRPSNFLSATEKLFNPFGLTQAIKGFALSDRLVGVIGSATKGKQDSTFIGGSVYTTAASGLKKVASNKTLGAVGDSRNVAALLRETPEVIAVDIHKREKPNFFNWIQDLTGVGPKFHEKRGGFIQTLIGAAQNLKGVASGEATLYGRPYKYAKDSVYGSLFSPYVLSDVTEAGSKIAQGKFSSIGEMVPEDLTPKSGILKGVRGWWERMKAYAGMNEDVVILSTEALENAKQFNRPVQKADLYRDFGRAGLDSTEQVLGTTARAQSVTTVGSISNYIRPRNYAASANVIDRLYDFSNWMTIRLNKLSSVSLAGFGFKPSGNLLANTLRVAAIPTVYYAGKESIQYANYLTSKITGEGFIEAGADAYTKLRVAQQEFRDKTGISSSAKYIEDQLLPGVDVGLLGSVGSVLAGVKTLEKTGTIGKAGLVAGAIYGLIGGPDVAQDPESLKREYEGEEKVPVRKARWWLLGYQPFKGGQIDYFKPSWYTELKEKPYDKSVYGSEDDYWKYGSYLPSPNNWFGLRSLIDPYALERKNYYNRPYPYTAKMFEDVPVVGPILADTIGQAIKPTKKMHQEELAYPVAASNISQRGVPTDAARALGIPEVPTSVVKFSSPNDIKDRIDKWFNVGLEPSGVWKFALGLFGIDFGQEYQMADASNMSSIGRRFYDRNLGGLFGETEFLRRFMLSEYSSPSKINQQINPIQNTMPRWLPGSQSENEQDRQYFTDFTRGDAYTKIPGGEFRLPGVGYEAVNRLHSGVSGTYSDVDKFLVLADVAPFSSNYFKYESIVNSMELSPYWKWKVTQAKDMRDQKLDRFNFNTAAKSQDEITKLNESTLTKSVRATWESVTQNALANVPIIGAKLFPFTRPYDEYLNSVVEGETFANWQKPFETIVRPEFYTTIGENPLLAAKRGFQIGSLAGMPGAGFLNPFPFLQTNPLKTAIAGGVIGGTGSLVRMGITGTWSHGFVPPHVEKERETKEYFDYLKYAKARYLESAAQDQGNERLARVFQSQSRNTINYGLALFEKTGDYSKYQSALDRNERPFFDAFITAPRKDQEKILRVVPSHMKTVLSSIWRNEGATPRGAQTEAADERAVDYFQDHTLPEASWAGWSPSVPDAAIQIKAVQAGINGVSDTMHRFGFYPAQIKEALVRFPTVTAPAIDMFDPGESSFSLSINSLFKKENDNPFANLSHRRRGQGIGPRVDWFSSYLSDNRRDDVFAFYQDIYR